MASSEVEVTSLAPFGCVLRDHNRRDERRDRCRDQNERASENFQKNLKNLVKDHLQGCISVSSDPDPSSTQDENSENWVRGGENHQPQSSRRIPGKTQNSGGSPSLLTTRQDRVLDRWASHQARVIVSTVEHEAELLSTSLSNPSTAQPSETATPPPEMQEVSDIASNSGAFSLVQIWEARLNRPQNCATLSRASSGISNTDEAPLTVPEPSPLVLERFESTLPGKDKSLLLVDLEPPEKKSRPSLSHPVVDHRPPTSSTSGQTQKSDEGEKSVRIVDIIKKLADQDPYSPNSRQDHDFPGKDKVRPLQETPELKLSFTQSRIIKGRQAFTHMLKQMEESRKAELDTLRDRQAVSKFSQPGRIQSMIKLRLMQRGGTTMPQDQLYRPPPPPGNKVPQGSSSTIKHLRERFNTCIEPKKTTQSDSANSRTSGKEHVNNTQNTSNSSSPTSQEVEGTNAPQLQHHSVSGRTAHHAPEGLHLKKETVPSSSMSQRRAHEGANLHSDALSKGKGQQHPIIPNLLEAVTSTVQSVSHKAEDCIEQVSVVRSDVPSGLQGTVVSSSSLQHSVVQCAEPGLSLDISIPSLQETLEITESINDWYDESEMTEEQELDDEEEDDDQQPIATNYDWISVISRPRSYWECIRQEWYDKMRNTRSQNEEIPQLLARKRVSSCLDSRFREIMDRMLSSHLAIQTNVEALDDNPQQSTLHYLQRHANQEQHHQDEQLQVEVEDEEEERNYVTPRYHESNGYSDHSASPQQLPSPSPRRDWSYHDSDTASPHLPSQSPPSYQGSHHRFSPRNTSSMEMEFMYGLRSHIEQIHQEISELRSDIRSCVDIQLKFQNSIQQEVYLALEEGRRRRSHDHPTRKGTCCICNEKRVDSFLYRCGHMCACFNCAHELQCSSGKCPMCGAAIDDVVRAHGDC